MNLERFRTLLLEERGRATQALERLQSGSSLSLEEENEEESYDNHLADIATATFTRELDYSLEDNTEQIVAAIDEALRRIEEGTFGTCARCGSRIAEERLEAMPYATTCIECKRRDERA